MTPGRVEQIQGELRAMSTRDGISQDDFTTLQVAVRLLESLQAELNTARRDAREAEREFQREARDIAAERKAGRAAGCDLGARHMNHRPPNPWPFPVRPPEPQPEQK